jgi:type 1 glutamine amidotransferase
MTNPNPAPLSRLRTLTAEGTRLGLLRSTVPFLLFACVLAGVADAAPPLKVLLVTSGGYHDYKTLGPVLTDHLSRLVNAKIELKSGLEVFADPKFAEPYDAVIYDVCEDDTTDAILDNVLQTVRNGKPAVMLHCSIHAFRKSPKISQWEAFCGMRSKVHDAFGPFSVTKLDQDSPITKSFPDGWTTPGDELYQTISIDPQSHQLLKAKSPRDAREHVVCWTFQFGKGRVFATTLGHDLKTVDTPEYLRLVANGLLWSCDKLSADGKPASGYSSAQAER